MPRNKRSVEELEEKVQDQVENTDDKDQEEESSSDSYEDIDDDDDEDDEDGDESEEEKVNEKEIQVDFEAYPTQESDFHGVRKLLQQLFLQANIDLSNLTEVIIGQSDTSFVIQQADGPEDEEEDEVDTEVYGISSMIDLSSKEPAPSVEQLRKFILSKTNNVANVDTLRSLLQEPSKQGVAWIVNERFINLPSRIALPCLQNLFSEVKNQPTKYPFEYFILVMKLLKSKGKLSKRKTKKLKKSGDSVKGESEATVIYQNPEEEILADAADESLEWNVSEQCDSEPRGGNWDEEDVKYTPWRKIVMLSRKSFQSSLNALEQELHSLPTPS